METILLVDDEPDILEFLSFNLRKEGFIVHTCESGIEAISLALEVKPDLIVLDVMMPGMDGVETCIELRSKPTLERTIITFLTARSEDYSLVAGLEAGADDYISKPIKPRVFVAKIKSLLRRVDISGMHEQTYESEIQIDNDKYIVNVGGEELSLPKKEFALLSLLMSKPNHVFERGFILSEVWGIDVVVGDRTIDVHIRKLREKVGANHIKTIKGVGYKFE